jgi:hypothetical protein
MKEKEGEMPEANLEKTHELLEKLAVYVMNEVPKKGEVPSKQEMNEGFMRVEKEIDEVKQNVNLILEGMDAQVRQAEILNTEQVAIKSGLSRVERRVEVIESKSKV